MLYWSKYIYHIVVLTEIYCRFTIIDYTTYSFLSLKCVYIFLADPVFNTEVRNDYRKVTQSNNRGTKSDFCVLAYRSLDSPYLFQFPTRKLKRLQNIEWLTAIYCYVTFRYDQPCLPSLPLQTLFKMRIRKS